MSKYENTKYEKCYSPEYKKYFAMYIMQTKSFQSLVKKTINITDKSLEMLELSAQQESKGI